MDLKSFATNKWFVAIAVGIVVSAMSIDAGTVAIATPTISAHFNASIDHIEWIANAFLLAASTTFVIFGRLGDVFGMKLVYLVGTFLFLVGAIVCGAAVSIPMLIVGRVFQGLGFGSNVALSTLIMVSAFPAQERGLAIGITMFFIAIALASGPFISAIIVKYLTWRWVFYLGAPLSIISFIMLFLSRFYLGDNTQDTHSDIIGMILFVLGLPIFFIGIGQFDSIATDTLAPSLMTLIGFITLIIFWVYETKIEHPFLDLMLLKIKNLTIVSLARMCINVNIMITFLLFPLMMQNIFHASPMLTASLMTINMAIFAFFSPVVGALLGRFNPKYVLNFSMASFCISTLFMSMINESHYIVWFVVSFIIFGFGLATGMTVTTAIAITSLPEKKQGMGLGLFFTVSFLGVVIGLVSAALTVSEMSSAALAPLLQNMSFTAVTTKQLILKVATAAQPITKLEPYLDSSTVSELQTVIKANYIHIFKVITRALSIIMFFMFLLSTFVDSESHKTANH